MEPPELVLAVVVGWTVVSVLAWPLLLLLCAARRRADGAREPPRPSRDGPPGPSAGHAPIAMQRLCAHAGGVLGADEAAVFVRDRVDPHALVTVAATGSEIDSIGARQPGGRGLAGLAMFAAHPLYVADCRRLKQPLDHPVVRDTRAAAAAPVVVGGEIVGALSVAMHERPLRLGLKQLALLGQLAGLVGSSLERREQARGGDPARHAARVTEALARVDEETLAHSDHVARLAGLVGRRLGLRGADLFELELGARLHDAGKLRVPAAILGKPGALDRRELELMRRHAAWGADLVASIPGFEAVSLVVRFHHERFDGRGYPDGLSGERIPLASRIVAVCDAYGAMTSERPYRDAMSPPDALRELERCAGSQFDPRVIELFVSGSLPDDLDHQPLAAPAVEFGVEDLLPRA